MVAEAIGQPLIGVDAPIAQERPVPPHALDRPAIVFDDEHRLRVVRRDGEARAPNTGSVSRPVKLLTVGETTIHGLTPAEISALDFSDVISMYTGGVRKKIANTTRKKYDQISARLRSRAMLP